MTLIKRRLITEGWSEYGNSFFFFVRCHVYFVRAAATGFAPTVFENSVSRSELQYFPCSDVFEYPFSEDLERL